MLGYIAITAFVATSLPLQMPVIGIYTQDSDFTGKANETYISASYVKWLEMAGAQVVPVKSYSSSDELEAIFKKINGLLFPGGYGVRPAECMEQERQIPA